MIRKPEGYENAPVYGTGDFESITPGGHICRIRAVKEEISNGNRQLVIAFDLAETDALGGNLDKLVIGYKLDSLLKRHGAYGEGLAAYVEQRLLFYVIVLKHGCRNCNIRLHSLFKAGLVLSDLSFNRADTSIKS